MRKILTGFIIALSTISLISICLAAAKGNPRKGKYYYRKNCRVCHQTKGEAKYLGPDSKTRAQWERAFKKEKIKKYECTGEWGKRSEEELLHIFTYLHKYADDSPSPAKCQ